MKKRILLIGGNFSPEPTGIGKYNGEMVAWLARQGYACTVITTYPYYPYWQVQPPYAKKRFGYLQETLPVEGGVPVTVYRCPQYVPAQPSGLKRILQDLTFSSSAFLRMLPLLVQQPFDVVISVVPSFHIGLLAVLYRKLRGARMVYHIQDLQIEAARDLQMIKSPLIIRLMFRLETFIFRQSDRISTISEGMVQRVEAKAEKPVALLPNWADTQRFYPLAGRDQLKTMFGFAPTDQVVLYSGAIGEKQGLESILYAAQALQNDATVKFVICGSGPYQERLQQLAQALSLPNVLFFPLQPLEKFTQFLNMADLHLVIQKANASDLVMPSKLTTILAVGGLALITANEGSSLHALVRKYGAGLLVAAENQDALNAGIRRALYADQEDVREKARQYAERFLDINTVMKGLSSFIEGATKVQHAH
ncbi:colanic acid biosynthesis glycosyl transferase WcaI [Catalinimonas alkaloidigena]|uniref:Colanic acid biosynthesis glycosyl transferase WcaI n=1 Tax=Catalinimonas alkaloidigena TaxID=1075417 RepID=A0A1G9J3C2_9BACT|nr:WcaI family glycosyltransferase [Catalinimonas alkaloidigena]SDL31723.1 colanic acid biosynthesis glycosyl transferase WcaI [Catalinimonas alkaloidigena]